MKKNALKGLCLMILAALTIVSCTNEDPTTATTDAVKFNQKSGDLDLQALLDKLYGPGKYTTENELIATDETGTYSLKHVISSDGAFEGYYIEGNHVKAYVQHNVRKQELSDYTDNSAVAEGIYDLSNNRYYLDHGFTPVLNPGNPGTGNPGVVTYGKKLSYGACSRPDANGNSYAGVYVTRNFLGFFSGEAKPVQVDGVNATVPCSGDPLLPAAYTGDY